MKLTSIYPHIFGEGGTVLVKLPNDSRSDRGGLQNNLCNGLYGRAVQSENRYKLHIVQHTAYLK
jgi:hypothetical protein